MKGLMSIGQQYEVMSALVRRPAATRLVCRILLDLSNEGAANDGEFPGAGFLADWAGVTEQEAMAAVAELEGIGALVRRPARWRMRPVVEWSSRAIA